ncbi:hypothetical protein ACJBSM_12215, partial [Streptococcus suis]
EVKKGNLNADEIATSAQRIINLKSKFKLTTELNESLAMQKAQLILGDESHRKVEADLALAAITKVKNDKGTLPIKFSANTKVHIIMP